MEVRLCSSLRVVARNDDVRAAGSLHCNTLRVDGFPLIAGPVTHLQFSWLQPAAPTAFQTVACPGPLSPLTISHQHHEKKNLHFKLCNKRRRRRHSSEKTILNCLCVLRCFSAFHLRAFKGIFRWKCACSFNSQVVKSLLATSFAKRVLNVLFAN